MKITIITVVYNARHELLTTLESINTQSYIDYEYIVIDGGSTDGTLDAIEDNKSLIAKYISEPDKGIYDAMNKGVNLASGDYIIFMNAGDTFFNSDVLLEVASLPFEADVFYGSCNVIGSRRNNGIKLCGDIDNIELGMVCSHQSMFFKASVLKDNLFNLGFSTAGDYELILRLWCKGFLFFSDKKIVVSNYLAKGVSDINRFRSVKSRVQALCAHNKFRTKLVFHYSYELLRAFVIDSFSRCKF